MVHWILCLFALLVVICTGYVSVCLNCDFPNSKLAAQFGDEAHHRKGIE